MKKTKKLLLIGLAVLMIVMCVPFSSFAAEAECEINGTQTSFASALATAKASTTDVKIKLLRNISITSVNIENTAGNTVTLDGAGYTVTTANADNALNVYTNAVFCNLKIVHRNEGSAIQILRPVKVDIDNLDIDASDYVKRNYTIINTLGDTSKNGESIELNIKNTNVRLAADPKVAKSKLSIIRTGNGYDNIKITVKNCNLDASGAYDGNVILVTNDTTATIDIYDSILRSAFGYPILANYQTVNIYGGKITSSVKAYSGAGAVWGNSNTRFYADADTPELYIYGCQETEAVDGKFKVRFICAANDALSAGYDNIKMAITVANATTVVSNKSYNISELKESIKANGETVTKTGYSFGTSVLSDLSADGDLIFTVELYAEEGGLSRLIDSETFSYTDGKYADSDYDALDYTINRADLTGRYLLISDLHYVGVGIRETSTVKDRYEYFGMTTDERMEYMCEVIRTEYRLRGLDGILVLGDLSTDDWYEGCPSSFLDKNYCQKVYDDYLKPLADELGIDVRVIAGNHDTYFDSKWVEMFGYHRQYTYVDGDNVFIMADTYEDDKDSMADGNKANGNKCIGFDLPWIESELQKYPDKNIFICSHNAGKCAQDIVDVISKYPNVLAFFQGHTHHYTNSKLFNTNNYKTNIPLIDTGGFSYGSWDNKSFDCECTNEYCTDIKNCLWGFQIVETSKDTAVSYRVDVANRYEMVGGTVIVDQPYEKLGELILK